MNIIEGNEPPILYAHEGTDAYGREVNIVKSESPNRIDVVSDNLIYLGWSKSSIADDSPYWKIKKIEKDGTVWSMQFANGVEYFRFKWTERDILLYL